MNNARYMACIGVIAVVFFCGRVAAAEEKFAAEEAAEENLKYVMPDSPVIDELKVQLLQALLARGISGKLKIDFIGREEDIVEALNNGAVNKMAADVFDIDQRTGVFSALLRFVPQGETEEKYSHVKARYEEIVQVPVLRDNIKRGEVIHEDDITWMEFPRDKVRHDTVLEEAVLIGKTSKRTLIADKPIRERLLNVPALVHKDDRVRMVYQTMHVKIVTFGMALEDGSKGVYIPVKNLSSGRVVHAMVTGKNEVVITPEQTETEPYNMVANE